MVKKQIELGSDPPPDLIIEVEVTHSAISKMQLYANIGTPEVWRLSSDRVRVYLPDAGAYREHLTSAALPMLTSEVLTQILIASRTLTRLEWRRLVRDWARARAASQER